eukprot:m.153102 g.153102  ORF g.153102 m.153102 type:complete len:1919 (+) comp17457_c0_seq2:51-5807(+)
MAEAGGPPAPASVPLFDKKEFSSVTAESRQAFLLEWFDALTPALAASNKEAIKAAQQQLLDAFVFILLQCSPGPPVRRNLARSATRLFDTVGTGKLSAFMQLCIDTTRARDDNATGAAAKLGAFEVIEQLSLKLGRMLSPFAPDALQSCYKLFRSAEPPAKQAILSCLAAMSSAGLAQPKDFNKTCIRAGLVDKALPVRTAAAMCGATVAGSSNYLQTAELDYTFTAAIKSLENSDYQLRQATASFVGVLLASTLQGETWQGVKGGRPLSFDDIANMLNTAFVKGASGGDLIKTDLLKYGQTSYRAVRVGIAHAYVAMFRELGGSWLEKQIPAVVRALLSILEHPKVATIPADAIHARNAVVYIVRSVLGGLLGEQGRISSVKVLCAKVSALMDACSDSGGQSSKDPALSLTCALDGITQLVELIGSPTLSIVDTVVPVLLSVALHPVKEARLAAAGCLRIIGTVVPSRASQLADQSLQRLSRFRASADGLHGTAFAFAAVVGGSASCALGLPNSLFQRGLSLAEELVKAAFTQPSGSKIALQLASVEAGWALTGALTVLGSAVVGTHAARFLELWKSVEASTETAAKQRNTGAWRVLLQSCLGSVTSIHGFVLDCKELVTAETQRLILSHLNAMLKVLSTMPPASKATLTLMGVKDKLRKRLFQVFATLPVPVYEKSFSGLLPHVVADITLNENNATVSCTSKLMSYCPAEGMLLLDDWPQEIDQRDIEEQLVLSAGSGLGTMVNDSSLLHEPSTRPGAPSPAPLPPSTAVVDNAVCLFGIILPSVSSQKHRLQLFEHFLECIKSNKGARRQAVLTNTIAALLAAFQGITQHKGQLGKDKVVNASKEIIILALASQDVLIRYAGTEAVARLAQIANRDFITDMVSLCSERLKSSRDVVSRTSFALALSTVHRYRSGRDGTAHLQPSVSYLHALANDGSPIVQAWSLHSLSVLIETSAFDFTPFIRSTLALVNNVILSSANARVLQAAGQALNCLIATIGPELQADTSKRNSIFRTYAQLRGNTDPYVQLGALQGLQQLILFAHRHVHLPTFLPVLIALLTREHLLLRRTAASALRQLAQREPDEIVQHWPGFEQLLFKRLDCEDDFRLQSDIKEILITLLLAHCTNAPSRWLILCNSVLSGATERQEQQDRLEGSSAGNDGDNDDDDDDDGDGDGDGAEDSDITSTRLQIATAKRTVVPTRWQSKVFAVGCVRKIIEVCRDLKTPRNPHFDMALAREQPGKDFLVNKLGELVKTSFVAATSTITELRKVGLEALQDIVACFATSKDIDMGGNHSLLEQYQAQVTAALRPAFSEGTSPDVTAVACKVSAAWLSSGVNRNASDLKRVLNLLETLLRTIRGEPDFAYNERATTQLRLGLLASWASLFVSAAEGGEDAKYLETLIEPHRASLSQYWTEALRDYATVILPAEYADQVADSGSFYGSGTRQAVRRYYEQAFPVLIHAAGAIPVEHQDASADFVLMIGLIVRTLCTRASSATALSCLKALRRLVPASDRLKTDTPLFLELCRVLHYTLRTQNTSCKQAVMDVLHAAVVGENRIEDTGLEIIPGASPVYAVLEVCASTILREIPSLNPHYTQNGGKADAPRTELPSDVVSVVAAATNVLAVLPKICPKESRHQILPSVLMLLLGVVQQPDPGLTPPCLKSLRQVVVFVVTEHKDPNDKCLGILLSGFQSLLGDLEEQRAATSRKACLLCAAIFSVSMPQCIRHTGLRNRLIAVLESCLTSAETEVQQLGLQVACSIVTQVQDASLASPFVRAVGPQAMQMLTRAVAGGHPQTEAQVVLFGEASRFLNAVTGKASEAEKPAVLSLFVPLLVAALQDNAPPLSYHPGALQTLMKLGPEHPQAFRAVVASAPQLKARIEAVVRAGQTTSRAAAAGTTGQATSAAPKIQLKMDFSAFKA